MRKEVHIYLGDECNFKCRYCYQYSLQGDEPLESYEFNEEFARSLVKQYENTDTTLFYFGGEPLMYLDNIMKFEKVFKGHNINRSIISNGSLLTPEIVRYWNKDPKMSFMLSYDGEHTNYLRGYDVLDNPKINNLVRGIDKLAVSMTCCDLSNNIFDSYRYTQRTLANKKFYYIANNFQCYENNKHLVENFDDELYINSYVRYLKYKRLGVSFTQKLGVSKCADGKIRNHNLGIVLGNYDTYDYQSDRLANPDNYTSACEYDNCEYYKKYCVYKSLQIESTDFCKRMGKCNKRVKELLNE